MENKKLKTIKTGLKTSLVFIPPVYRPFILIGIVVLSFFGGSEMNKSSETSVVPEEVVMQQPTDEVSTPTVSPTTVSTSLTI